MEFDTTQAGHSSVDSEEARTLSDIYSFLALTMRYPDPSFCTNTFLDTLEALLNSLHWQADLIDLQGWRQQSREFNFIQDLQLEYTGLFINAATTGATIPPYASVYMDGDRNIQGRTTEQTRDFYRACGFDIVNKAEPADHLQHELEFLAALVGEERFADEEHFLKTLFRPWFQRFHKQSIEKVRHPYYAVSLKLIDFFTKEEQ